MPNPNPAAGIAAPGVGAPDPNGQGTATPERAAVGPTPPAVSAAENPAPGPLTDSAAEALGRRTLSTAFVNLGPGGHMTVELRDGRVLVLRDVIMRAKDYCGVSIAGDAASAKYCGGYAEVVAARPGGAPAPGQPDSAAANAVKPTRP